MSPFEHIFVSFLMGGGTRVEWRLSSLFPPRHPGPYTFAVDVSVQGVGDWVRVGVAADHYLLDVSDQRAYGKLNLPFYRVTVTTAAGKQFASEPVHALAGLVTRGDRHIALDILRKDRLLARRAGRPGWLYKRRHFGTPCTANVDQDTGGTFADAPDGEDCYGTEFRGGYFAPVCCSIVPSTQAQKYSRRLQIDLSKGQADEGAQTFYGRTPACPWLDSRDVWVDGQSDQRYVVGRIWHVDYRGEVIIFDPVELRLAPRSDLIYKLPRPDAPVM